MPIVSNTPSNAPSNGAPVSQVFNPYAGFFKTKWFIYGAPKAGKTTVAATAGKKDGSNIIWVMLDNGGINTIIAETEYNVVHYIDVPQLRIEQDLKFDGVVKVIDNKIKETITTDPTRDWVIVVDGLTQLDGWITLEVPKDSSGKPEWTRFKAMLGEFFDRINKYQRHTLYLAHAAINTGDVRSEEKTRDAKLVSGIQAGEIIKPDITGKGVNYFMNAADAICFLVKTTNLKGETVHTLYLDGGDKGTGGLRFASFLPEKVENANIAELVLTVQEKVATKKGLTVEQMKNFGSK